uniref:hypothetical protein n=1 Tax=Promineifilum sp. TaxID=2664178 RepID=UPI0035B09F0D
MASSHAAPVPRPAARAAGRPYAGLLARLGVLALIAFLFWLGLAPLRAVPAVTPADATPLVFSAERAVA